MTQPEYRNNKNLEINKQLIITMYLNITKVFNTVSYNIYYFEKLRKIRHFKLRF